MTNPKKSSETKNSPKFKFQATSDLILMHKKESTEKKFSLESNFYRAN